MTQSIRQAMRDLPESSVTVYALRGLDFVVPGEWKNVVDFNDMVREVTGETDAMRIQQIAAKADKIYKDDSTGYQKALWIYQTIDTADVALGTAAMANKVGERIGFLSFLSKLTPKADVTQSIDLGVKVVGELVAFAQINGIPRDTAAIGQFSSALGRQYTSESLMRMAALVCLDGIVPLGPDFTRKAASTLGSLNPSQLENNAVYKRISKLIPGDSSAGHLSFINQSIESVQDWMNNLMSSRGLTPEKILSGLSQFIEIADDKLDYVAAFLDVTTNYYSHTGTQSVAHSLIDRAA